MPVSETIFLRCFRREQFHSLRDFDEALAALAVFVARCRNFDTHRLRAFEEGLSGREIALLKVEV
jgi:hypothetical protein